MRRLTFAALWWALPVSAQDACESRCNQAQAACLRTCVDSKDNGQPQSQKLMQCLHACTAETKPCRDRCHPASPPPPPAH